MGAHILTFSGRAMGIQHAERVLVQYPSTVIGIWLQNNLGTEPNNVRNSELNFVLQYT